MGLIVLEPGIETRVVDLGRPGTRSLGIPVGGAADRRSLVLGNALIGNPAAAAAVEFALKGPRLRAEHEVGCALFGAPFRAQKNGEPIEPGHSFTLREGEELEIGGTPAGVRGYLCVVGGIASPSVLASRSGLRPVARGATLPCRPSRIGGRTCPDVGVEISDPAIVSVLPGLQASWFDETEFYGQAYTITPATNRMGVRLRGKPLAMPSREMVSEAVCPGSVQVTRDGQCIVLGVDGQTIGGYPKVAQVIQADLDVLGQLRPGQAIRFEKVTLQQAIQKQRASRIQIQEWSLRLRLAVDA